MANVLWLQLLKYEYFLVYFYNSELNVLWVLHCEYVSMFRHFFPIY